MKKIIRVLIIMLVGVIFIINRNIVSKNDIALYVDNQLKEVFPNKGEAIFTKAVCDNDVNTSWDNDNSSLTLTNLSKKTKCNLYFSKLPITYNFDYTGSEQTFTALVSGTYKLELWGAQGGGWGNGTVWVSGAVGGYATGNVKLSQDENIFINIGREGDEVGITGVSEGHSGGGASYITLASGNLTEFENNLSQILIVAGSGGGSEWTSGGSGGGYIGTQVNRGDGQIVTGGTQTSGGTSSKLQTSKYIYNGSFGKGGYTSGGDGGGQGGAGFYGGGASDYAYGGAGGSGYIGNPILKDKVMYCYNCQESSEESTKTISTTCSERTPTENCAKQRSGYARITLVSID